ncbi:chloride channel protein [Sphingobium nicotianae]|uniref:Chloride channel protein n=1 Tax=Sphingobium nicotianae TaxID=2782607 RepID=A0A9X1ISA9_9SPHN|nr:chloride channel protein [Sphingobium nicotianae]MBT2187980.1 chloride channel protein [Sphingobium nicotianae]
MRRSWKSLLWLLALRQRRFLRESEAAFILLAALAGLSAGLATNLQQWLAHGIQHLFYGVAMNRLSALASIHHPWRLLALPIGGLLLACLMRALRHRKRAPIDVVEANALHGGRIPFSDNLVIAAQTILSNGAGASVGLEATYAQMGGGIASVLGQWLKLRRNDLRTLVGAGAGAAVGAAFGAPLTGAFYAFEIVIGNYTPAAVAPVMAAALSAAFVTRALGVSPYLIATTADRALALPDYLAYAALGLICAAIGIAIMRLVTFAEQRVQRWTAILSWRPVIGGALLIPLAWLSPQSLSAGHGALHLDLLLRPALSVLLVILLIKIAASVISLSFGFRGGLFFASLFLGSLIGQIFAGVINDSPLALSLNVYDAALVGMAALSVSIVGGPMTLAMLMLETTHDFALMGVVLTAALLSSSVTREAFGYSFSTWRLHLRGSTIRSPRDIGWALTLTAGQIMRKDWVAVPDSMSVAAFRAHVPLGSTSKAIMVDAHGAYRGIISTASAYSPDLDGAAPIAPLATLSNITLAPDTDIQSLLSLFDRLSADEIVVADAARNVLGIVTEKHARRRYFEEFEASQREVFGEGRRVRGR